MSVKKIYLVSPPYACGLSWVDNCFLELGIRLTVQTTPDIFVKTAKGFVLHHIYDSWKVACPILSDQTHFHFRNDILAYHGHLFPDSLIQPDAKVVCFIRDPRNALFSMYKITYPSSISFSQYLAFPLGDTLLDPMDTWNLFVETWLLQPNTKFFRFEDYKDDAEKTLRSILEFCEIEATDQQIQNAVEKSTSQRAKEAEKRYLDSQPKRHGLTKFFVHNRASQKNETAYLKEIEKETSLIASRCGYLMKRFGYIDHDNFCAQPSYLPNSKLLGFYKVLNVPKSFWERPNDELESVRISSILQCFTNQEYSGLWDYLSIYEFLAALEHSQKNKLISQLPTIRHKIYWIIVPWFVGYGNARKIRQWICFIMQRLKQNYHIT